MKRFAAHYVWSVKTGFKKQQVVEVEGEEVSRIFPLTEEIESVEWLPGVIVLTSGKDLAIETLKQVLLHPNDVGDNSPLYAYLLYPFDFTLMQPVSETRHRQLR